MRIKFLTSNVIIDTKRMQKLQFYIIYLSFLSEILLARSITQGILEFGLKFHLKGK